MLSCGERSLGSKQTSRPPPASRRASSAPAVGSLGPSDILLQRALASTDADERARLAREALALDDPRRSPDTTFLLLRQLYLAHLEHERHEPAIAVAREMLGVGVFADLAHNDLGRVHAARGDFRAAIAAQRDAIAAAPPERRSFQAFFLATLEQFSGDLRGALATVAKAERWAGRDRPLVRALGAHLRLEAGLAVPSLDEIVHELSRSKAREGYGQYLLGMLAHQMGDVRRAGVHLRAFLRRNAAIERAKRITLEEELRRARRILADQAD